MKLNEVTFREANLESDIELRRVAEIDMAIPPLFDPTFPYNENMILERIEFYKNQHENNDFFELALDPSSQLIGFHIVKIQKDLNGIRVGRIDTLWVRPENRNQGIAKNLKYRAESWAKSQGLKYLFTWVQASNKNMLEMNQKLGFEIVNYKMQKNIVY
jgi:GNAT superfamily N-acetyltransferase